MQKKSNKAYFKKNIDNLNKDLPLKLSKIESIINEISNKYPALSKTEISLIVKSLFEELREGLIQGDTIFIQDFINHMKLYTYCAVKNDKLLCAAKVQINTSEKMREVYARAKK